MDRRSFLSGLLLFSAGCSFRPDRLRVGSKNFTEQLVIGEIVAQMLDHVVSRPVEKRFYLAGSYICHQAMLAGRIDTYVEYTGTAVAAILKEQPVGDHEVVYHHVKDEYSRRFGLEIMPPLGFNNSFAIVMRGDDARQASLKSISDLARLAPRMRLGVGYEFLERRDGYQGLANAYGLHFAEMPRVMDLGLMYRALQSKQVDVIAGANTDGLIAALDLVVLDDDRRYFPPYDAVPVVRRETLERYPAVRQVFDRLANRIDAEEMRQLNYEVDGNKRDAAAVASDYLTRKNMFATLYRTRQNCRAHSFR
jgi:glycine betaine/choline ABC-type transport system substrate-binding protein